MAKQSLEEKIESLEKEVQRLKDVNDTQEKKISNIAAINEIQNLMSRYEYMLGAGLLEEITELFAQKTPGVRAEMMWGVYEGTEGIKKLYPGFHKLTQGDRRSGLTPGWMNILPNTTSVIEVAQDGKTAKGVWICPGIDTMPVESGKSQAKFAWAKRAADFVKEDGKWKIWHYHVYGILNSPFEKSWAEGFDHPNVIPPDGLKADKPPTTYWMYKPDAVVQYEPVPPEPYDTFDEKTAY